MTEIGHYRPTNTAPLTSGARFVRGFRRIGIALAGITLLIGIPASIGFAVDAVSSAQRRYEQSKCIMAKSPSQLILYEYDRLKIDLAKSGCDGPMYAEIIPVISERARTKPQALLLVSEPLGIGFSVSIAVAAIFLFGFWLLGWICAGFTRG